MTGKNLEETVSSLDELIASVADIDLTAQESARRRWDSIAKPIRGLGLMEHAIVRVAGIQRTPRISIKKKCVVVMCADHGVIKEGISQADEDVTRIVAENFSRRKTSAVENRKIARGTANMLVEAAMTRQQALAAVWEGACKAKELSEQGYELVAVGEMGAGNTTAASAIATVLLGLATEKATGRGAGLSDEAYKHKIEVIRKAIERNSPDAGDPVDVLSKVGGLDIAGMAGVYLGCASSGMAAVADGIISLAAALIAVRLCPLAGQYILPSHRPAEPAGDALLKELDMKPFFDCGLALGEGAGAVMLFPLLDMADAVYEGMDTFEEINVGRYQYHAGGADDRETSCQNELH